MSVRTSTAMVEVDVAHLGVVAGVLLGRRARCARRRPTRRRPRCRGRTRVAVPLNRRCSRKCVEPRSSSVSSREPTATQKPMRGASAPGMRSLRTRTPVGRTVRRTSASPVARNERSTTSRGSGTGPFIAFEPTGSRSRVTPEVGYIHVDNQTSLFVPIHGSVDLPTRGSPRRRRRRLYGPHRCPWRVPPTTLRADVEFQGATL